MCEFYKAKSVFEICGPRQTLDSCFFLNLFKYLLYLFTVTLDLIFQSFHFQIQLMFHIASHCGVYSDITMRSTEMSL